VTQASRPRITLATIALAAILFTVAGRSAQQNPAPAQPAPQPGRPVPETVLAATATEVQFRAGLAVGLLGSLGRSAVPSDFLGWQLATGAFREPRVGDTLGPDDRKRTQTWAMVEAGADGWIQNRALNGGYLFAVVNSDRPRTMILDSSGYYVVRVNGEPRGGEKYGTDWVRHPVKLVKGRNTFLFQGERGRIRARLFEPPAPVFFTDSDATLPDLVLDEPGPWWVGLRLVNASDAQIDGLEIRYKSYDRDVTATIDAIVPPMMTRKIAIPLRISAPLSDGPVPFEMSARARTGAKTADLPPFKVDLKVVNATAHHARTFVSEIDGSVQSYGVVPPSPAPSASADKPAASPSTDKARPSKPALVVSLHGAGVEGMGQAKAYKPKDWAVIIAPTNRRPYGFDWEDWGRLDALEAMADAQKRFGTDPLRTFLTGHSMGGHGTWQIGATEPGVWAAIAPSAGWRSFSSYGGGPAYPNPTAVDQMLVRANHPGETTELAQNFLHYGVYILHGDKDDNVPVAQARFMRELLAKFHPDFAYYERPGAGHWWGDECVDWPPLFDFLKRHARTPEAEVTHVDFTTANPGISSRSNWVTILAQDQPLEYSRVVLDRDPKTGAIKGTTKNVSSLVLDVPIAPDGVKVDLDGTVIPIALTQARIGAVPLPPTFPWRLERGPSGWAVAMNRDESQKSPQRSGGFKDAFRHRVMFVYGTRGPAAERAQAFNKARLDAEAFWYRGNGSVDVVADSAFDPSKARDRNVVLYGNADTNAAWAGLLPGSPIEVRAGLIRIGGKELAGTDLAAYFIRPRADNPQTSVGVVAWTGAAGWVAATPVQYFVSGAGFPDVMIFGADMLRTGTSGVRVLGWFGNDWGIESGAFAWGPAPAAAAGKEGAPGLRVAR